MNFQAMNYEICMFESTEITRDAVRIRCACGPSLPTNGRMMESGRHTGIPAGSGFSLRRRRASRSRKALKPSISGAIRDCLLTIVLSSCLLQGQITAAAPGTIATTARDVNKPAVIPITVNPGGFERKTLTLPRGFYLFVIRNRSGLYGLQLTLERMPGNSIAGAAAAQTFTKIASSRVNRLSEGV